MWKLTLFWLLLPTLPLNALTLTARTSGGNWSAAGTWSTSGSGGGAASAAPTPADDVILEAGSGNVTVDWMTGQIDRYCRSLDTTRGTGNYAGTLTTNSGMTLHIGDGTPGPSNVALKLNGSMTFSPNMTSILSFESTSATQQTIDFAGLSGPNLTFNGAGGSWKLLSAYTQETNTYQVGITLIAGSLDTNSQAITADGVVSSGTATRSLTLGTSTLTLATHASGWAFADTTGLTFSGASSTITVQYPSATNMAFSSSGGPSLTFGTFNISCGGTTSGTLSTANGTTFATLSFIAPWYGTTCTWLLASNIVVTGTLTLAGWNSTTKATPQSTVAGTVRHVTNVTRSLTNYTLTDIVFGTALNAIRHRVITGGE